MDDGHHRVIPFFRFFEKSGVEIGDRGGTEGLAVKIRGSDLGIFFTEPVGESLKAQLAVTIGTRAADDEKAHLGAEG